MDRGALRETVKRAAARFGYDVHRRDLSHPARRVAAMAQHGVNLVLDVGANEGQYVGWLREFGYRGRVVSFEPLPAAYAALAQRWGSDSRWTGRRSAVGASAGTATLNVTQSSVLSSLLQPNDELTSNISQGRTVQQLTVDVVALDDIWDAVVGPTDRTLLKIDTQGYENAVLDGVEHHLNDVALVEIEMALTELYLGGSTIHSLLPRLHAGGFDVISIDSGFVNAATGQVLDVDMLLGRRG